jgi:hypothetical protein
VEAYQVHESLLGAMSAFGGGFNRSAQQFVRYWTRADIDRPLLTNAA